MNDELSTLHEQKHFRILSEINELMQNIGRKLVVFYTIMAENRIWYRVSNFGTGFGYPVPATNH